MYVSKRQRVFEDLMNKKLPQLYKHLTRTSAFFLRKLSSVGLRIGGHISNVHANTHTDTYVCTHTNTNIPTHVCRCACIHIPNTCL